MILYNIKIFATNYYTKVINILRKTFSVQQINELYGKILHRTLKIKYESSYPLQFCATLSTGFKVFKRILINQKLEIYLTRLLLI